MSTSEGSSAGPTMDTDRARQSSSNSQSKKADSDTGAAPPKPKRPKIEMAVGKKIRVLTAIMEAYAAICTNLKFTEKMMNENVTTSRQVALIMYLLHKKCRFKNTSLPSTVTVKSEGNGFTSTTETLIGVWTETLANNGLPYEGYDIWWFDTMSAYLITFRGFGLRMKELRLGCWKMPLPTAADGRLVHLLVSKYGLKGYHHLLLEGISYPPKVRTAMAQYVGPMTAFLCMLWSYDPERAMWAKIVKRTWSMVSFIDTIIRLTEETKSAAEIYWVVVFLAEILLRTNATIRHGSWMHMHYPLCMLYKVYAQRTSVEHRVALLDRFHYEGDGGYYLYKECQLDTMSWVIEGNYTPEQAAQLVFHSIFGTSREDLTLLEQITNVKTWFRRDQFGNCFTPSEECTSIVEFKLPELRLYPRIWPAHEIEFRIRDYRGFQSVFSGYRTCNFGRHFFYQIQESQILHGVAQNLTIISDYLGDILDKIRTKFSENNGMPPADVAIYLGKTCWRTMATLTVTENGAEAQDEPGSNPGAGRKYFMEETSD